MRWDEWRSLASDVNHWTTVDEKGLLKAEYLQGYELRLWFEEDLDVVIYDLDWKALLIDENPGSALLPLRDIARFRYVKGDYALIWPNPETDEYDEAAIYLAPECVRFFCERYGTLVKAAKKAVANPL
jgi:hypothetical protein